MCFIRLTYSTCVPEICGVTEYDFAANFKKMTL